MLISLHSVSLASSKKEGELLLKIDGSQSGLNGEQFITKTDIVKVNPNDTGVYSIKCWQNGVAVIEENNKTMPNIQAKTITMFSLAGTAPDLYMVDMGSGFCKISKK